MKIRSVASAAASALSSGSGGAAPVAVAITPAAFNEDIQSGVITLSYTDVESDKATSCALSGLVGVTVSEACACDGAGVCTVKVTGTSNFNGAASFNYTVTANSDTSNSAAATFTINPVADTPVAVAFTAPTFNEDTQSIITLQYSDGDSQLATVCTPASLTNITVTQACACDGAGVCTIGVTGTANYNGAASFAYTVTAGGDISNSVVTSLAIAAVNDVPVAAAISPAAFLVDTASGAITLSYTDTESDLATACTISALTNVTVTTACACDGAGVCTVGVTGTSAYVGAASFGYTVTTATASTSNVATATLSIIAAATKVVFTTEPSATATAGTNYATQPVVTVQNAASATVTSSTAAITLAAFTDAGCTVPATGTLSATTNPLSATAGVATFAGINHTLASTIYLKATSGALTSDCSSVTTISADVATKVALSGTSTMTQSSCSKAQTLTTTDVYDNTNTVTANKTFNLGSTGSGIFYSDDECTAVITDVTVNNGSSTASYYYKNTVVETTTLTGSLATWTSGTMNVTTRNPNAAYIFGQPDFNTNNGLRKGLRTITSLYSDGTKLFVDDHSTEPSARVAVWNTFPTTNYAVKDSVFWAGNGDPSTSSNGAWLNPGQEVSSMHADGTHFIGAPVAYAHKVYIWNTIAGATSNGNPDLTLGVTSGGNFWDSATNALDASGVSGPRGVFSNGTKLAVVAAEAHRVMIWNTFPTISGQAADVVVGQANLTTGNSANEGGAASASSISDPRGIWISGTKMILADKGNNRVLIWNTIPTANHTAADVVIGQTNFTNVASGITANNLHSPEGVFVDAGGKLYIADSGNHRVLIYNSIPVANNAAANFVLGQADFISDAANRGGSVSASTLNWPTAITKDSSGNLAVADSDNRRVLIWTSAITTDGQAANAVVGQESITASTGDLTPSTITSTNFGTDAGNGLGSAACTDGTRLFLADGSRKRVLVWNTYPTADNQAPDYVLGQANFTTNSTAVATEINGPVGMDCDSTYLAVTASWMNRVLIWNVPITSNNQQANVAVGHADFTSWSSGTTSSTLNSPTGVSIRNGKLLIADRDNHRVLVWNTIPTTNGVAADLVLGQPDFTSGGANQAGGGSLQSLSSPMNVIYDGTHVIVAQPGQFLIWNSFPTVNQQAASVKNSTCSGGQGSMYTDGTTLYMSDDYGGSFRGYKTCVWNTIPTTTDQVIDRTIGFHKTDTFHNSNITLGASANSGNLFLSGSGNKYIVYDRIYQRLLIYNHKP